MLPCSIIVLRLFLFVDFLDKGCQLEDDPRVDCVPQHQKQHGVYSVTTFSFNANYDIYCAETMSQSCSGQLCPWHRNRLGIVQEAFHRGAFEVSWCEIGLVGGLTKSPFSPVYPSWKELLCTILFGQWSYFYFLYIIIIVPASGMFSCRQSARTRIVIPSIKTNSKSE